MKRIHSFLLALCALALGFVSYGLSVFLYVRAQNGIGAAKTSAYYAVAPFIGVFLSFLFLGERLTPRFFIALCVMAVGTVFAVLQLRGADARTDPVAVDGHVITGRGVGKAIPFALAIVAYCKDRKAADDLAKAIVYA